MNLGAKETIGQASDRLNIVEMKKRATKIASRYLNNPSSMNASKEYPRPLTTPRIRDNECTPVLDKQLCSSFYQENSIKTKRKQKQGSLTRVKVFNILID